MLNSNIYNRSLLVVFRSSIFVTCVAVYNGTTIDSGEPLIRSIVHFNGRSLCGGVLISWNHVLTAAHCSINPKTHKAHLGTRRFRSGMVVKILSTHAHPLYNSSQFPFYDIKIVTLKDITKKSLAAKGIRPIDLYWNASKLKVGTKLRVFGFGRYGPGKNNFHPKLMRSGVAQKAGRKACLHINAPHNESALICEYGDQIHCAGDSGGPLVYLDSMRAKLVGIVSGSVLTNPRCTRNRLGFSTNIEAHYEWINSITKRFCLVSKQCPEGLECQLNGVCEQTCRANVDCVRGLFCESGTCLPSRDIGQQCKGNIQCFSENCKEFKCAESKLSRTEVSLIAFISTLALTGFLVIVVLVAHRIAVCKRVEANNCNV